MAQFAAADGVGAARKGRSRRFLDLHLHQLAAHASYVRAWAEKYKDKGLVVIGVHTPEFRFEKNIDNVRREVKALRVDYPVAVDSEYVIWRGFSNNYWPALYFIDAQGRVRHHHFGEGSYEQSEMVIQRLLAEAGAGGIGDGLVICRPARLRSSCRLGEPQVSGKLCWLRTHRGLCVAGRRGPRQVPHV